jgi:hypothetical protein
MIKPLRKYHFIVWRVFALVLPIAFTMALVLRPISRNSLPNEKDFEFNIVATDSHSSISVDVFNPIQAASCVVYAHSADEKKYLLGSLNNTGHYSFRCSAPIVSVSLYDAIRQREIITHRFQKQTQ